MKIAYLGSPGQLDSLAFEPVAAGECLPDQVEINVSAVGLNFKDVLLGLGLMPTPPGTRLDFGFECSGTVSRTGSRVRHFVPGDAVVAIGVACLASAVRVDADSVCHRPTQLSAVEAATMPIAFLTASYAMEDLARVRAGDRVLIHAATGGVGLAAVQLAQRLGCEVFATAGTDEKREFLRRRGVAHVMNSRTADFADEVLTLTNQRGVDLVLNSLSGDLMLRSLDVVAPHGRFIELGARDAIAGQAIDLRRFRQGVSYCTVGYQGGIPDTAVRLRKVMERAASGEFAPLPRATFPADRAGEALQFLATARHIGKVVVEMATEAAIDDEDSALLSPTEGARIFELCLASPYTNVAISKTPLAQRLAQREAPTVAAAPAQRHPRPAMATEFVAPSTEVEIQVAAAWTRHFGIDPIGVHDDFFALGGDSLLAVQIAYSMRSALKLEFPTHLLLENPTIAALAAQLDSPIAASRSLVQLSKGPAGSRPLFLVHPIGGHVYFYLPLAAQLSEFVPVYGLQAQGVDGEAPPIETIEEMAAGYIEAMREAQQNGPYRLGGSSFGGVVAFEMAQQLLAAGETVEQVVLIDSPSPESLAWTFRSDAEILAYLLAQGGDTTRHAAALSTMSEDEMLAYFLVEGGAGQRLSKDATIESVRHFLNLFRANYNALIRYQPRPLPLNGLFFNAMEHDQFNPLGFDQVWTPFFKNLQILPVPGNHTTMNLPPHSGVMVRHLQTAFQGTNS